MILDKGPQLASIVDQLESIVVPMVHALGGTAAGADLQQSGRELREAQLLIHRAALRYGINLINFERESV